METHASGEWRVSVVVVSFNTIDKLRRCLNCLANRHEVIVIDNASRDGSPEMVESEFPAVKLIRNTENRGFGSANNQGTAIATGNLWLYLNSDAYAEPGAIDHLAATFEDAKVVVAGGLLLWPDGEIQQCSSNHLSLGRVFFEQSLLEKLLPRFGVEGYWNTHRLLRFDSPVKTPQVMGAAMMVRAGLETFDERFFLYCEDTDLCKRLERHGIIVLNLEAKFIHELGSSSRANPWLGIARYNAGKELYFRIHHGEIASYICWSLNRSGALLRLFIYLLASVAQFHTHENVNTFWRVLTARASDRLSRPS